MPDSSPDSLDALYRAAQLVSSSPEEADRLVRRVLGTAPDAASDAGATPDSRASLSERLASAVSGSGTADVNPLGRFDETNHSPTGADAVLRAVIRRDIRRSIPDAVTVLAPGQRVRLAAAAMGQAHPEHEVTRAFVRLVRARLPWRQTSLTDADYHEMIVSSVGEFIEQNTEPISPAMRSELGALKDGDSESGIPEETADRFLQRSRRFAIGLVLIVVAALLGTWLSTSNFEPVDDPPPRLFDAIMEQVDRSTDLVLQTADAGQAERYVRDRFGWSIVVPQIEGASMRGVGSAEVVAGIELAVIRYQQSGDEPDISVFIVPYALIQQMRGEVGVDRTVLDQIADEGAFDVVITEDALRVAWRRSDDVYVAVLSSAVPGFEDRITMP